MKAIFFSTGGIHLATMLGMLSELQNRTEDVNAVGGVSAGALLAALCASYGIDKAITVMKSHYHDNFMKDRHKYLNTLLSVVFNNSIVDSSNLKNIVSNLLKNKKLVSDLYIGYTNRDSMEYKCNKFEKGKCYPELYKHVVASMSIPCVLEPTTIKDNKYIDAGMFHTIPVEAINTVVEQSIKEKEPLDLMVLSAKPWGYHLTSKLKENTSLFPMLKQLYHLVSGYECIAIHNDQLLLNKILENAKLKGDHVNYSMFSINQKQTENWTHKLPFEEYGHIKPEDVDALINLGKSIVLKCIKSDLKF